jgi:hypothetical protein
MEEFVLRKIETYSQQTSSQLTREIRWFFGTENPLKHRLKERYLTHADFQHRIDTYYPVPGRIDWGLKSREGKYELKRLTAAYDPLWFSKTVSGKHEGWEKWEITGEEIKDWEAWISDNGLQPFSLEKKRWVSKMQLDSEGKVEMHGYNVGFEKGCQIEYTELSWDSRVCFTFGLELFGGEVWDKFLAFFSSIFENQALKLENSYGYPCFIEKILGKS